MRIAFTEKAITREEIENNQTIKFLAYTDEEYCGYKLKCATLPLMNIKTEEGISDEAVPMVMTLFDNQQGIVTRLIRSDGTIHIRGGSTREYSQKGYRFSLLRESGRKGVKPNDMPLLGMRQDDDWLLYATYNDSEKIRNVFSSNLCKYICASDNSQGIDAGMEYQYLELFIDGEYNGLYVLGYPIDEKQVKIKDNDDGALFKNIRWVNEMAFQFTENGNLDGYEVKSKHQTFQYWSFLLDYYYSLYLNSDDNSKLYAGIDNAIDFYLFLNLVQGADNSQEYLLKNQYLAIKKENNGLLGLYISWDMDISWGNLWTDDVALNYTIQYGTSPEYNYCLESGYFNQLIENGDASIWERLFSKYWYLRRTVWSEESISNMLNMYEKDIYDSGAYLRDMARWPDGSYASAAEKLETFHVYVLERLKEADLYYERLEAVCDRSVFIRRSAKYKNFLENNFVVEINYKELLQDTDYVELLEYIGIDMVEISDSFDFTRPERLLIHINTFTNFFLYLQALPILDYKVIMEINNTEIWKDSDYAALLERLNLKGNITYDKMNFEISNDLRSENVDSDIRIILIDANTEGIVDEVSFMYELNDVENSQQIVETCCIRNME